MLKFDYETVDQILLAVSIFSRVLAFLLPVHNAHYMGELEHGNDNEQSKHDIDERTLKRKTAQADFQEYQAANNMQTNNDNAQHDDRRQ